MTMPGLPADAELRRFLADCNARRHGWAGFQKGGRRAALRMVRSDDRGQS